MGRKAKVPSGVKIKVVEDYLKGKTRVIEIVSNLKVSEYTVRQWICKYQKYGSEGLITKSENKYYPSDIKLQAINDFIAGESSAYEICMKYDISSRSILQGWIKQYNNSHKKSHNSKGDKIMTNGRKTTYEERVEIVSFCIANANDYNLTAHKYEISYQQVYTWVKKYNKNGYDALVDRRGKHKTLEELSESERIAAQLKLLEAENRRLKMENDFLKKLEEIERR
ncbi:MAG: helix-turn-helix domain-containing protein [Clostridiaceae bacterium]